MKYCAKCGKEILADAAICPGCGCPVEQKKEDIACKQTYEQAIQSSATCGIIAAVLLALGILAGLFVSVLIGAALCLAAEIVAVIPNTRMQKLFKMNNSHITDKKMLKADEKALRNELKEQNKAFAFTRIIAVIALIGVIAFALLI